MQSGKVIFIAVDGSLPSENAVRYGGSLAKVIGAEVLLFHVMESEKIGYWLFIDRHFHKELEKAAAKVIDAAKQILDKIGVEYRVETREGKQATYLEIVQRVEALGEVVGVIMGDRGVGLREHQVLGSTTDRVLHEISKRDLPVPVTVVAYSMTRGFVL
jgi:nucleotide-binding universal stress UspA family protein